MTQSNSEYKKDSKLITAHYAENYEHYYNAIVPPIFMNSLNVFEHIDAYYDCDTKDINTYVYGRVQNPTVRIVEEKIAALEHGAKAALFASGMAATTTAILSTCKMGSNVVCFLMDSITEQSFIGKTGSRKPVWKHRKPGRISMMRARSCRMLPTRSTDTPSVEAQAAISMPTHCTGAT